MKMMMKCDEANELKLFIPVSSVQTSVKLWTRELQTLQKFERHIL